MAVGQIMTTGQGFMNQVGPSRGPQSMTESFRLELVEILKRAREIAETAYRIDLRQYESESNDVSPATVCQSVLALRTPTLVALNDILVRFDEEEEDLAGETELGFLKQVDTIVSSAANERRQIADLAFLAITEISYRFDSLEAAFNRGHQWDIISGCGNCLGAVLKALTAAEKILCEYLKTIPQLEFLNETRISVEIRIAYQKFFYALQGDPQPNAETVATCLRKAGNCMATLIGREVYPRMRASDRMQIRHMQARILDFFAKHSANPSSGIHLWKDLVAFAELLLGINQRADLVEHDRKTVRLMYEKVLSAKPVPEFIPAEFQLPLKNLFGRDPELDGLLEAPQLRTDRLADALKRLYHTFVSPPDHKKQSTLEFRLIELTQTNQSIPER